MISARDILWKRRTVFNDIYWYVDMSYVVCCILQSNPLKWNWSVTGKSFYNNCP